MSKRSGKPFPFFFFHFERTKTYSTTQGTTHKLLKGHSKWVFCLNYNTASNLLVSGGCDGDVRIWNTARGSICLFLFSFFFLGVILIWLGKCMKTLHAHLDYVTAVHFNRDATLIVSCALDGLMYVMEFFFSRSMCSILFFILFKQPDLEHQWWTVSQNISRRSQRHLVRIHKLYISFNTILIKKFWFLGSNSKNKNKKVNMFNFPQTQNTFSQPHTIVLSVFGIIKLHDVWKPIQVIPMQNIAFRLVLALLEGNG